MMLDLLPGDAQTFYSADSVKNEDESLFFRVSTSPGWRCTLQNSKWKLGPRRGLCNGTRLLSTRLHTRVLEAIIFTGDHAGQPVLLPRITLKTGSSAELPFTLHRTQFPIRLAMVMTFSKLQEQLALARVGMCLEMPVFSHGQLFVALSRATNVDNVRNVLK
ncbi:BZ3501_MvSof-1269-A2-R1_Chr12-3g03613 [Microbotryum saponariae]|nr:BZ3501_MvSof-1269-A2-R1_Chr12-3g03613 [Microbotryum saponariae]